MLLPPVSQFWILDFRILDFLKSTPPNFQRKTCFARILPEVATSDFMGRRVLGLFKIDQTGFATCSSLVHQATFHQ